MFNYIELIKKIINTLMTGDNDDKFHVHDFHTAICTEETFLPKFSSNSESFDSELLENLGRNLSLALHA